MRLAGRQPIVFDRLERGGELRARTIKVPTGWRVRGRVVDKFPYGPDLMTDEHASYQRLKGTYNVHSVNHSAGEMRPRLLSRINGIS